MHYNIVSGNQEEWHAARVCMDPFLDAALACGGTVSAEHGIGKIKKQALMKMYGEAAIAEMVRVKNVFDPHWILNPGNVLDSGSCIYSAGEGK